MRPVDKGTAPKVYAEYQDASQDLKDRLGDYCSYCERQIETNLAVEHKQPKSLVPQLITDWTNFLLGCVNCNSSKGDTPINLEEYLWPDTDNTLFAFEYSRGGIIHTHRSLSPELKSKSRAMIGLVGLDRDPGNTASQPTSADRRWRRRQEIWLLAEKNLERLVANDSPAIREGIVETAIARGMFSIWWTVFAGDSDMRRRIREEFVGTHEGCFDASENLLPRPGGQV